MKTNTASLPSSSACCVNQLAVLPLAKLEIQFGCGTARCQYRGCRTCGSSRCPPLALLKSAEDTTRILTEIAFSRRDWELAAWSRSRHLVDLPVCRARYGRGRIAAYPSGCYDSLPWDRSSLAPKGSSPITRPNRRTPQVPIRFALESPSDRQQQVLRKWLAHQRNPNRHPFRKAARKR